MTQDLEDWEIQGLTEMLTRPAEKSKPLVTIITPCLNSVGTIGETLLSVLAAHSILQRDYWELEHLLIDGGSTDGSSAIIASHVARHGYCRSIGNITGGPYSAMNIGLQQARGHYIHVLNSDDFLLNPKTYVAFLKAGYIAKTSVLLATIGYFRRPDRHLRSLWHVSPIPADLGEWRRQLTKGLHYPHPGFIADSTTYKQQSFDTRYRLSADYKLMQAILLNQSLDVRPMVCRKPLVAMAEGGATGNWKAIFEGWLQLQAINRELDIQASGIRRYWRKLKQRLCSLPKPILIQPLEVTEP
jgi:glycosyltransferase involved in cell wall biosynthesis